MYLLANEPCAYISNNTTAATVWRDNGLYKKNAKETSQSASAGQREVALLQARFIKVAGLTGEVDSPLVCRD